MKKLRPQAKKILAREWLIFLFVLTYTISSFFIIDFVEKGNFNYLEFKLKENLHSGKVVNTYIFFSGIIVAYGFRSIFIIVGMLKKSVIWAVKILDDE